MTLSQVAFKFGLGKSSAFRLLRTLREMGYVCCSEPGNHYFASSKLLQLGRSASLTLRVQSRTVPYLRELRRKSGLTVQLAALEDRELIVLEKLKAAECSPGATWVGKRLAMHSSGLGKAVLAYLAEEEIDSILRIYGMQRYNANTIVSPEQLKMHLREIRYRGFAFENEEYELGIRSLAAPIIDGCSVVVAAVSATGSVSQITSDNLAGLVELVKQTAQGIGSITSRSA